MIDKHGLAILEHAYQSYADDLTLEIIQKALNPTRSIHFVPIEYDLPSRGFVLTVKTVILSLLRKKDESQIIDQDKERL